MAESKYTTSKVARAKLGVCNKTLRSWALNGKVDFILTEGKNRRYNVDKYLKEHNLTTKKKYVMLECHLTKKRI